MRAFKDLREFLQVLEAGKQLLRITEAVRSIRHEAGDVGGIDKG
jgi:hypothetical protein